MLQITQNSYFSQIVFLEKYHLSKVHFDTILHTDNNAQLKIQEALELCNKYISYCIKEYIQSIHDEEIIQGQEVYIIHGYYFDEHKDDLQLQLRFCPEFVTELEDMPWGIPIFVAQSITENNKEQIIDQLNKQFRKMFSSFVKA